MLIFQKVFVLRGCLYEKQDATNFFPPSEGSLYDKRDGVKNGIGHFFSCFHGKNETV